MGTTWAINASSLAVINFGHTALAEDGFSDLPWKKRNTFFKLFAVETQQTGLDHGDLNNAGGELPDARCFDQNGRQIGYVFDPGTYLPSGQSQVFWAGTDGRQPHYTLFSANRDAQCIAFVTASWPNLDRHFGWVGDWGQECAGDDDTIATWYFSNIAIPGTEHFPNCLWIDYDGGQPATAFQVNWPDMKPLEDNNRVGQKAYDMCHSPSFHIYQHLDPAHIVIHKRDDAEAAEAYRSEPTPSRKRDKPRRSVAEAKLAFERKYGNILVIDDLPSHTARSLCESTTSAGPSFVNPEHGYYCDMKTKAIHPVCSGAHRPRQNSTFCFDMDQNELVGPGLQKRATPFEVQDWRNSKIY